jgi:pimeloyl-ACP methyl ester carboxylesterase
MLFVYITLVISSWVCRGVSTYNDNDNDNGNNNISIDESLSLSTTMTNLVEQHGFREEVIDVSGVGVHVVIKDPSNVSSDDSKDIIVFIHGTASASVTFFDIMDQIPPNVKCVAIDLPSFGISDTIDVEIYPSNEDMCIGYANIIGETLHKLSILDNTVLVWHSLGGFLSIYVAARYPIKKLVLLNPAGILPTLGVWGYYWAIFFKAGLPTSIYDLPHISRVGMKRIITPTEKKNETNAHKKLR